MGLTQLREAKRKDFVRVEYIENTSTAYIDTLYVPNADTEIEFDFQYNETLDGNKYIGSISKAVDDRYRRWHLLAAPTAIGLWRNSQNQTSTIDFDLNKHIYRLGGNYTEIDGIRTEATSYNYISVNHFGLFARIGNATITEATNEYYSTPSIGKMTYCKIWQSGTLVRDFIPMYQISTDTYGLWDRVEEKFYTSPNGVKFTGGARVVADVNDNLYYIKNYISSNNNVNAYITLRKFHNTDNVEFEIYKKQNADNWFGSRQGSPARNLFALNAYGGGININWGQSPTRIVNGIANDRKHKVRLWDREVFVNGTKVYTCGTNTFTTNTNVTLGKVDGITSVASNCNWYYFKWWDVNKDLVYDLIPVQSVETKVYGMFDKVNLQFHSSNGTAQFIGG